jgi:hypothetical protein
MWRRGRVDDEALDTTVAAEPSQLQDRVDENVSATSARSLRLDL